MKFQIYRSLFYFAFDLLVAYLRRPTLWPTWRPKADGGEADHCPARGPYLRHTHDHLFRSKTDHFYIKVRRDPNSNKLTLPYEVTICHLVMEYLYTPTRQQIVASYRSNLSLLYIHKVVIYTSIHTYTYMYIEATPL